eukprot:6172403-Pleurochrysis_carterae.AAC.1
MKLKVVDQVCVSPIQNVTIYGVRDYTDQYYLPSDGFSLHDAHPDGYGNDSAPQSFTSLISP